MPEPFDTGQGRTHGARRVHSDRQQRRVDLDHLAEIRLCSIGSNASIARMLNELAAVPHLRGVMLTFDDFRIEQFGTRILPLMRCHEDMNRAA